MVNQPIPHEVIAVFPEVPGSDRIVQSKTRLILPAKKEGYVLGYRGAVFFSRDLSITLNPDSTLKEVKLNSETQVAKGVEDLNKSVENVGKTVGEIKEAQAQKKKDPVEGENESLKKELLNLMLKANKDAAAQGQPLPYPDAGK